MIDSIKFYQSLTEEQKLQVEKRYKLYFPPEKMIGYQEDQLFLLKCTIAQDMFGKKILKG